MLTRILNSPLFIFLGISLVLFANTWQHGLLVDDYRFFIDPKFINIKYWWTHFIPDTLLPSHLSNDLPYYRPFAHIIPMFFYQIFGHNPIGYHVVNSLLHGLAAFMIYQLVLRSNVGRATAFLTGLFYLIHPINSIVVNYKTASIFSVLIIFMVLSVYWSDRRSCLSIFAFMMSLLCHEVAIIMPAVILLWFYYITKIRIIDSCKKIIPYLLIAFIYVSCRFLSKSVSSGMVNPFGVTEIPLLFATYAKLIYWYFQKIFFPFGTVLSMTYPLSMNYNVMFFILCVVVLILVLSISIFIRLKEDAYRFYMALIVLGIGICFPASTVTLENFHDLSFEPHWMLFSSIGIFLMLAIICARVLQRSKFLVVVLLISVASNTFLQNRLYANDLRYLHYWVDQDPNNRTTLACLADVYFMKGEYSLAKTYYQISTANQYFDWKNYGNLALIYESWGDIDAAIRCNEKALQLNPGRASILVNLGVLYLNKDDLDRALEYFNKALKSDPLSVEAYLNLASLAIHKKDDRLAEQNLKEALKADPSSTAAIYRIVEFYIDRSNLKEALDVLNAHAIYQKKIDLLVDLSFLFYDKQLYQQADELFIKASRLNPSLVYLETGKFLANKGKFTQAIEYWEKGMRIDPQNKAFQLSINRIKKYVELNK